MSLLTFGPITRTTGRIYPVFSLYNPSFITFVFLDDTSCLWYQLSLPSPQCLSKVFTSQFPGAHRRGTSHSFSVLWIEFSLAALYILCGHEMLLWTTDGWYIVYVYSAQMYTWSVTARGMISKMLPSLVWTIQTCLEWALLSVGNHLWVCAVRLGYMFMTVPLVQSLTIKNLWLLTVPENSENEADALLHFTAEFSSRWVKHEEHVSPIYSKDFDIKECWHVTLCLCPVGMEKPIQCFTLGLWRQRPKKPSMAKPEMWVNLLTGDKD